MKRKAHTQALHLNLEEIGLMSNLLFTAMQATGKEFKDQPMPVKMLSTKIAKAYERLERHTRPKTTNVVDFGSFKMTTITEVVKGVSDETPQPSPSMQPDQ